MDKSIVFIDVEVGLDSKVVVDAGACKLDGSKMHSAIPSALDHFIGRSRYICGHNIVAHDLRFVSQWLNKTIRAIPIDTLLLSPLLFPNRPYHHLLKDDKLQVDELNNPLNDSLKAMRLFQDEAAAFDALPIQLRRIYCTLLYKTPGFHGFFGAMPFSPYNGDISIVIREYFDGRICSNADVSSLVKTSPVELAYALALISAPDRRSIMPPWLMIQYPRVEKVLHDLCGAPCKDGCAYCKTTFDVHRALKKYFGYLEFRKYEGVPLQENAVEAAVRGESLLAVFPTGGGKSLTFQLPALIAGDTEKGLTVVISPLQSLMKDQVDNLEQRGIVGAVTINGLLNPVERKAAIDQVMDGTASILYIAPESLRSKTVEKMLLSRNVVRFVVDEAHCFSAWGQDFRVDYLYIGEFIKSLQEKKKSLKDIPVSCFTATAKQKVITDICDYFHEYLGVELKLFTTDSSRKNLQYYVQFKETDEEKYVALRNLIDSYSCPTIVYVSRTKKTWRIAEKLQKDGLAALPFNGKMDADDKVANQDAFMRGEAQVIVATSAFGMGVDKSDVGLVVHYDISDSLENYVQEAGRAGRDASINAHCYVLYNNEDLDKHFMLLNQTKLSISEIQQVWRAIKSLTKQRATICCSPLEIQRFAGWDDGPDSETRVKTAIAALETAGYVKRGRNMPRVYANSIQVRTMDDASKRLEQSEIISGDERLLARRILSYLIGSRSRRKADDEAAESRVDYIADRLGVDKTEVISCINNLRQEGLLADDNDMTAFILPGDTRVKASNALRRFSRLEQYILQNISMDGGQVNYKELNARAMESGISGSTEKNIRTLLYFLTIKHYLQKVDVPGGGLPYYIPSTDPLILNLRISRRESICRFIINEFYDIAERQHKPDVEIPVQFSVVGLLKKFRETYPETLGLESITLNDIEDALLYLTKINALKLEGGFLVLYNGMEIHKLVEDNSIRYKKDDYKYLDEFYRQRIQQIHIVGKYANLMMQDYSAALSFVRDYFNLDYKKFIAKYFSGDEQRDLSRNITTERYDKLFGELSEVQRQIIDDNSSQHIVVTAGPGSGKTKVLVHKLAALMQMEDVKHEQLLMLTFSRAAATEFKKRLLDLVGNAALFIDMKTFHSYCFDLLGRPGNLEGSQNIVAEAVEMIRLGEVEPGKITKKVLVIDEAQDMDENEFSLIEELIQYNDDLKVVAVGDDDQNIYEFRGSDSKYMQLLISKYGATQYEMLDNYRSAKDIVDFSDVYAKSISTRLKIHPAIAVRKEHGIVELVHHNSGYMENAIVEDILQNWNERDSLSVLTQTNEEALRVLGLLRQKRLRANLIQSNNAIKLYNLVEIRMLLKELERRTNEPIISKEIWDSVRTNFKARCSGSSNYALCDRMLSSFEAVNDRYYKSDLEEYIRESKLEDFFENREGIITVSTIHKAKGREFDRVYLLLDNFSDDEDERRHVLYVGMTRAKNDLKIHYNNRLFDKFQFMNAIYREDPRVYLRPQELVVELGYQDLFLDTFKPNKQIIFQLRGGDMIDIQRGNIYAEVNRHPWLIGSLSKAGREVLARQTRSGYRMDYATVDYIVAWKKEGETEETPITLLSTHFTSVN